MNLEIRLVDYSNVQDGKDLAYLMNCYASDPMGGGSDLPAKVRDALAGQLAKIPSAFSFICYADNAPAGLINCFEAFSTFNCKPLINIHDVVVASEYRGLGISSMLLDKVEEIAKEKQCCKLTLEVLEGNEVAKNSYIKNGFSDYILDPAMGKALFWQKLL
jgi:ribosomal protein S18 acetylase RimI-like enzyme